VWRTRWATIRGATLPAENTYCHRSNSERHEPYHCGVADPWSFPKHHHEGQKIERKWQHPEKRCSRRSEDSVLLDKAEAMAASLTSTAPYAERPIEPCSDVLTHTAGMKIMTDDNMGSEWRYFLALD
jgi:hypothetical protein